MDNIDTDNNIIPQSFNFLKDREDVTFTDNSIRFEFQKNIVNAFFSLILFLLPFLFITLVIIIHQKVYRTITAFIIFLFYSLGMSIGIPGVVIVIIIWLYICCHSVKSSRVINFKSKQIYVEYNLLDIKFSLNIIKPDEIKEVLNISIPDYRKYDELNIISSPEILGAKRDQETNYFYKHFFTIILKNKEIINFYFGYLDIDYMNSKKLAKAFANFFNLDLSLYSKNNKMKLVIPSYEVETFLKDESYIKKSLQEKKKNEKKIKSESLKNEISNKKNEYLFSSSNYNNIDFTDYFHNFANSNNKKETELVTENSSLNNDDIYKDFEFIYFKKYLCEKSKQEEDSSNLNSTNEDSGVGYVFILVLIIFSIIIYLTIFH